MNEEEILKECTELAENEHHELGDCWDEEYSSSAIFGLIMLYKQTKKELKNIKEIEKSHQEENGKLRIELEQYKLLEANIDKANKIIAENKFDEGLYGLLMQEKEKNHNLIKQLQEQNTGIQDISRQLRQEKEKNKDLEEKLKIAVAILTKGTYPKENEGDNDFDKQFIAVDKIKEKLELLKDILKAKEKDGNIYKQIPIEYLKGAIEQLEELLEMN